MINKSNRHEKKLSILSLSALTVASIASPIGMVIMSKYGLSALFYCFFVIILFFIPTLFASAELGTLYPQQSGLYRWVTEAFGMKVGFFSLWAQWLSSILGMPVITTFNASLLAYIINPEIIHSPIYVITVSLTIIWLCVIVNVFGLKFSVLFRYFTMIFSGILPALVVTVFAIIWLCTGHHSAIPLHAQNIIPSFKHLDSMALLVSTLFMFAGIEMSAYYVSRLSKPRQSYPKALFIAAPVVSVISIIGTLAIAILVKSSELSIVSGLIQAFSVFLNTYHLFYLLLILVILLLIGQLGATTTLMVTTSEGLFNAAKNGNIPSFFTKRSKKFGTPHIILYTQGIIITLICGVFYFMSSVSRAYWAIEDITAQASIIRYIILFITLWKLRYLVTNRHQNTYKTPGGAAGFWFVILAGILSSVFAFGFSFLPPSQVHIENIATFEITLCISLIICCILPFIISLKDWRKTK